MEFHPDHTMYHSKIYDYAKELLDLNPHRGAKDLQHMISYWKNVPEPPLGTCAHWCAYPKNLPRYAEEARRRETEARRKGTKN